MGNIRRGSVTLTTATGGGATGYITGEDSLGPFYGTLESIRYTKTDFASTADFTITDERTGETLWAQSNVNASAVKHPGVPIHTTASGGAITGAHRPAILHGARIKVVITQGGNTKTGAFEAVVQ